MKYLFFLGSLVFLAGLVFAAGGYTDLIAISSMDATAHACKSPCSDPINYPNLIQVPDQYFANCTDPNSTRILGLSSAINAHMEQMSSTNYKDVNVCLKSTVFTSFPNLCYFSASGASCSSGFNCVFGMSGNTNAHPSLCGLYSNEVKFCCLFIPKASCPMNLSISNTPVEFNHPSDINFVYNCPAATSAGFPTDIIITDSLGYKKTFPVTCFSNAKFVLINTSELLSAIGGDISHNFNSYLKSSTSPCASSEVAFIVRQGGASGTGSGNVPIITIPITGVDCNIQSFGAQNILVDSNVNINFSCYFSVNTGTISILNPYGAEVFRQDNVPCGTNQINFTNLKIDSTNPSLPSGVYTAKFGVGSCSRDFFFSATNASKSQSVADAGLLPVLISLLLVVFFISKKRRK